MKKLLLSVLLATVMFGGAAVEVTASANAKTEHTTKHHAKKKAVKKHAAKKHAKKATKKHAKKVVKKHVAQKTTKKKARKVAKKHVKKSTNKNYMNVHIGQKLSDGYVISADSNGYVTSTGTDKYGNSGQNIHYAPWMTYHGDGSKKSWDEYHLNMAKHDPYLRKELKAKGAKAYLADIVDDEVTF